MVEFTLELEQIHGKSTLEIIEENDMVEWLQGDNPVPETLINKELMYTVTNDLPNYK